MMAAHGGHLRVLRRLIDANVDLEAANEIQLINALDVVQVRALTFYFISQSDSDLLGCRIRTIQLYSHPWQGADEKKKVSLLEFM